MYNRYIPQSDGTFRRSTVQERPPQQQNQERTERKQNISVPQPPPSQAQNGSCPPPPPQRPEPRQKARGQRPASKPPCKFVEEPRETSAGAFLRNLLNTLYKLFTFERIDLLYHSKMLGRKGGYSFIFNT